METQTHTQFGKVKKICADIFIKKMHDYGPAWQVMRLRSITDQIFIKAQRIRSIREKKVQRIKEEIDSDLIAIFNYSAIGLIQIEIEETKMVKEEINASNIAVLYEKHLAVAENMIPWQETNLDSWIDLMLMKLLSLRGIENTQEKSVVLEAQKATYYELIGYSTLAYIRLKETE